MYFQVEIPCEAQQLLSIYPLTIDSSVSSVAGVKETQTGQVDVQWIMVMVVNYHVLCANLCRIFSCWKLQHQQFRLDLINL